MSRQYKYIPLGAAADEFTLDDVRLGEVRLIRLLPAVAFADNIEIEIFHARSNFQEEPRNQRAGSKLRKLWNNVMHHQHRESQELPAYEALSYVWGSYSDLSFVYVRGKGGRDSSRRLTVTHNLAEALRYLRKEDESRILWVDAICINQKNLVERGVQVARMGNIFRNATQVNIWLGPEYENSNIAVDLVHSIAKDLVAAAAAAENGRVAENFVLPSSETATLFANADALLPKIKAVAAMCSREWFNRLWIYQEFHMSKVATAFVGKQTFNVRDLYKVLRFIRTHTRVEVQSLRMFWTVTSTINLLRPVFTGHKEPWQIVRFLKDSSCSDERDRVYAILGLLDPRYSDEIVPDYRKTTMEVYQEFFLCSLKLNATASVVRCGEYGPPGPQVSSWIPDLSSSSTTLDWCSAAGKSKHEFVHSTEDNSLRLPAVSVGKIAKIWFQISESDTTRQILQVVRSQGPPDLLTATYPLGGTMLDAYLCSLAGGKYHEAARVTWFRPLHELRRLFQSGDFSEDVLAHIEVAFAHVIGRSIFSTEDGLIGLCPFSAKAGDEIFVTPGVFPAILLSEVEGRSNNYRIKGECYVHGFMNTEAFLGHLTEVSSEGVWSYQFQKIFGDYAIVYKNGEITTQNDPRLDALPEGWKKVYWSIEEKKYFEDEVEIDGTLRALYFHNLQTNEMSTQDPRLISTALKARGLQFKDVIIV